MNKEYQLITCIILTYKKFQYFYTALDSVLIQDYPAIELIISDDGTECFPKDKINEYINKNKKNNIKLHLIRQNEKNVGIVKHANIVLKYAHGSYIINLSGDDKFYESSTIRKIVDKFIETDADILSCRRIWCKETGLVPIKMAPCDWFIPEIKKMNTTKKQFRALAIRRHDEILCGASLYYKRNFLMDRHGFDESYEYVEDHIVCLQYLRTGKTVTFADDIVSIYYREGGISTGTGPSHLIKDNEITYEKEIIPYMRCLNKIDRRYIKFICKKTKEYTCKPMTDKLLFILKNLDMCILFKYYKWMDKAIVKLSKISNMK